MSEEVSGRKVFILNPHSVMKEELLDAILAAEYELYLLKDPQRALRVFSKFPDSIVFINIDSGMKEPEWERYIRELRTQPGYSRLSVGILSYNPEPDLVRKYLMDIGVQCGFVRLRLGMQESTRIMLQTLEANEAKGRRRYVRARTANDPRTSFNIDYMGQTYQGPILDISSVGMAVRLGPGVSIPGKTLLPHMQLRLRATLVHVAGVVLGSRDDDASTHVILFRHDNDTKARYQIRQFINRSLQDYIDRLIA